MAVFDSPAARGELNEQVRELHQLESTVEHFANGVADFSHALGSGAKGLDPRCVWSLLDEAQAPEGQAREAVRDAFEQLDEFGTMLNTQLHNLVLSPLHGYRRSLSAAQARARRFDEESEALDAARLRALGESKDATLELRALAQHQIDVKAAAAEVSWHDTACGLREAAAQRRMLPQKVASQLCPPPPPPPPPPPFPGGLSKGAISARQPRARVPYAAYEAAGARDGAAGGGAQLGPIGASWYRLQVGADTHV